MVKQADAGAERFHVVLIKPSHFDDDGYVIQWHRAWIPSHLLACVYGLAIEAAETRALGADVEIVVDAYDETNTVLPLARIVRQLRRAGGRALVCLVGVQSNQFPRAMDIARVLRRADLPVAIGGFHPSGCIAMLPSLPPDLEDALGLGITLFAGEAEGGRLEQVFRDAWDGRLKSIYDFMADLPDMREQVTPFLPEDIVKRYIGAISSFDAGRGCPFQCSFCTIINVQGRISRWRDADDIERLVRANLAQGVLRFFIPDDNFARNRNWEAIFDRLIEMREGEGLTLQFIIQVDTLCHRIPDFVEKAARAGCTRVFIGLENINPDNLLEAKKRQNKITEYRTMLQAWRAQGIITYAGYILGFPNDTPESIARDIEIIKRELPVDLLEFFCLTPLPGSEDHRRLFDQGVWMDPDMNKYDLEHVCTTHPRMSAEEWQDIYRRAWHLYYADDHVETLMRRAAASGIKPVRMMHHVLQFYGSFLYEDVHPLQSGYLRRKVRRQRRSDLALESPLIFYPRRLWEVVSTYIPFLLYFLKLTRMRKRIQREAARAPYTDLALTPVGEAEDEALEMFRHTDAAKAAVDKAKRLAAGRRAAGPPPEVAA